MATLGQLMSDAIRKLARREARAITADLRCQQVAAKRIQAGFNRQLQALERVARILLQAEQKRARLIPVAEPDQDAAKARITARTIIALRRKLKLSQDAFAKLVAASSQAVYLWEHKSGALRLRDNTRAKILAVRKLSAREAHQILESKGVKSGLRREKR